MFNEEVQEPVEDTTAVADTPEGGDSETPAEPETEPERDAPVAAGE